MLRFSKTSTDVRRRVRAIPSFGVRDGKAFAFVIRSYHLDMSSAIATSKTSTDVLRRVLAILSRAFSEQGHVRPSRLIYGDTRRNEDARQWDVLGESHLITTPH